MPADGNDHQADKPAELLDAASDIPALDRLVDDFASQPAYKRLAARAWLESPTVKFAFQLFRLSYQATTLRQYLVLALDRARGLERDVARSPAEDLAEDLARARELARYLTHYLDLDLTHDLHRDLAHTRDLARALGHAHYLNLDQAIDLTHYLDLDLTYALDQVHDLHRDLHRDRAHYLDLDLELVRASYLDLVRAIDGALNRAIDLAMNINSITNRAIELVDTLPGAPALTIANELSRIIRDSMSMLNDPPVVVWNRIVKTLADLRAAAEDMVGVDLSTANLTGVPLVGLRWSSKTLWPEAARTWVIDNSEQTGPDLFQIQDYFEAGDRETILSG